MVRTDAISSRRAIHQYVVQVFAYQIEGTFDFDRTKPANDARHRRLFPRGRLFGPQTPRLMNSLTRRCCQFGGASASLHVRPISSSRASLRSPEDRRFNKGRLRAPLSGLPQNTWTAISRSGVPPPRPDVYPTALTRSVFHDPEKFQLAGRATNQASRAKRLGRLHRMRDAARSLNVERALAMSSTRAQMYFVHVRQRPRGFLGWTSTRRFNVNRGESGDITASTQRDPAHRLARSGPILALPQRGSPDRARL